MKNEENTNYIELSTASGDRYKEADNDTYYYYLNAFLLTCERLTSPYLPSGISV